MNFKEASEFVISFGKFIGKTVDEVASTDSGLLYIDWIIGQDWLEKKYGRTKEAIESYLADDGVQRDLRELQNEVYGDGPDDI